MKILQQNAGENKKKHFILSDNGKTITIKQPSILEISLLYQVILANITQHRIRKINFSGQLVDAT